MAEPVLTIAGVDRTNWLAKDTGRINWPMAGRATFDFLLRDAGRGYKPVLGNSVSVTQGASKRFAGRISSIREVCVPPSFKKEFRCRALDYNHVCDHRRITKTYENETLGAIAADIASIALSGEGISTAGIETGPTIAEVVPFNLNTVTEAYNRLAQISAKYGYPFLWYIDFEPEIHFSQFSSSPAPFSLTDSSNNFLDLEIGEELGGYRNVQHARTEYPVAPTYVESFTGNGALTGFITRYPVTDTPTLTVNGSPVTVGELGVDESGKDFYWIRNGNGIFNEDHATLSGSETLEVTYRAQSSNIATAEDLTEIAARAVIEGGSGRYEAVDEQKNISTYQALVAMAEGALAQQGRIPKKPAFKTYTEGLEPGQRITINLTRHGINEEFLIESVSMIWRAARVDFIEFHVQCTDLPFAAPAKTRFFERLTEIARIGVDAPTSIATTPSTPTPPSITNDGYYTITYSATITPDLTNGTSQRSTLTGNVSIANPIYTGRSIEAGHKFRIRITQDGTGGRTVTWGSAFTGLTDQDADLTPGRSSTYSFTFDGTYWELDSSLRGIS